MQAYEAYNKDCLQPIRRGDYDASYTGLNNLLNTYFPDREQLGIELSARLLLATCIVNKIERLHPSDLQHLRVEFEENLKQYWRGIRERQENSDKPSSSLGFKPFCDYFEQVVRFSLFDHLDTLGEKLFKALQQFREHTAGAVENRFFYEVWIAEIDRERRGIHTSRQDHLARAIIMGETLSPMLQANKQHQALFITLNRILADTHYYYHEQGKIFSERAKAALNCLDAVLSHNPGDPYALNFRDDILQALGRHTQMDRFNHDSRSILGSLNQISKKLLTGMAEDSPFITDLHRLRRQVMTLRSIAMLAEGQDKILQPSSEEYEFEDIGVLIQEQLENLHLPNTCLVQHGTPEKWEIIPGMVGVVFDNLIRNSLEAYKKNNIPEPSPPVTIIVHYQHTTIFFNDEAGGVNPAVGDIFAPYASSKGIRSRVGLGLTNAKMAMKSMEADIRLAELQPPNGTSLLLTFSETENTSFH